LAKRPTLAIGIAKRALGIAVGMDSKSSRLLEPMFGALTFSTKDQKEGMNAFIQKREPAFRGK
jgi:enoyl-CoA hydratase/carnithine racemase